MERIRNRLARMQRNGGPELAVDLGDQHLAGGDAG